MGGPLANITMGIENNSALTMHHSTIMPLKQQGQNPLKSHPSQPLCSKSKVYSDLQNPKIKVGPERTCSRQPSIQKPRIANNTLLL